MTTRDKIGDLNGFTAPGALRRAALDHRVAVIEDDGMDPGRVFVHLAPGWRFDNNGNQPGTRSQSVGSAEDVRWAMASIVAVKEFVR